MLPHPWIIPKRWREIRIGPIIIWRIALQHCTYDSNQEMGLSFTQLKLSVEWLAFHHAT